jgi:hypothetical protein
MKSQIVLFFGVWLIFAPFFVCASSEGGIADVAIAVDTSYSMEQSGIFPHVKTALQALIERIPAYYDLLLITFDTDARFFNQIEPFIPMTAENKKLVLSAVSKPTFRAAGEKTDIGRALELSFYSLRERSSKEPTRYQVMALLTDGVHDPPVWSPYRDGWNLEASDVSNNLTRLRAATGKTWYFAAIALSEASKKVVEEIATVAGGTWIDATTGGKFDKQKLQSEFDEVLSHIGAVQVTVTDAQKRVLDRLDFGNSFQGRKPKRSPLFVELRSQLQHREAGIKEIVFELTAPNGLAIPSKQITKSILIISGSDEVLQPMFYLKPNQPQTLRFNLNTKLKMGRYTGQMAITPLQGQKLLIPIQFSIGINLLLLIGICIALGA